VSRVIRGLEEWTATDVHELAHLFSLHALFQLALLCCCESVVVVSRGYISRYVLMRTRPLCSVSGLRDGLWW